MQTPPAVPFKHLSWEEQSRITSEENRVSALEYAERRAAARVHPLGATLPQLDYLDGARTTRLGVTTVWSHNPKRSGHPLLDLYSWSVDDYLTVEGRTFTPGAPVKWRDPVRLADGGKPWKVTLLAVATEHIGRVLHLCPALMVRLYNGAHMFALPSEVDL